jgi:hypothetical protein
MAARSDQHTARPSSYIDAVTIRLSLFVPLLSLFVVAADMYLLGVIVRALQGFEGRVYVQLLGVIGSEVVAGRFLPMAKKTRDGTSWFCSEEAMSQKRGEEKLPKVSLRDEVHFDYPSMQDLGELALCRVFCLDHKQKHWHLHKVAVAIKEKKWEFPCDDQTRDETHPVPAEFLLPLDSQGDDELMSGLRDLMERDHEAKIEHQLSQELGLTEVELKLLVTSRNILKRKLRARHAVSPITSGQLAPVDEERGMLPVPAEDEDRSDMSTVHLAVKAATKTLAADNSDLQEGCALLAHPICSAWLFSFAILQPPACK